MDYKEMALDLLKTRIDFLHVPVSQKLSNFIKGEYFVLNYLLHFPQPVMKDWFWNHTL